MAAPRRLKRLEDIDWSSAVVTVVNETPGSVRAVPLREARGEFLRMMGREPGDRLPWEE